MTARLIIILSAFCGCVAVIIGAFGAHALKKIVSAEHLAVYQTAVQYHFYHTLALLFLGLFVAYFGKSKKTTFCAVFLCLGIVLFSGSLYLLVITGIHRFGMITPIGGVSFICGWLCLFAAAFSDLKKKDETRIQEKRY